MERKGGRDSFISIGGQVGLTSLSLLSNDTSTGSTSFTETITDQSYGTTSSSDSWSDYQAGSFSANSLSLSSVNSSDTGSDSWSSRAAIPSALPAKRRSCPASTVAYIAVSPSGTATVSQSETVTLSGTVSGTDTASANDSYSYTGGDTYSISAGQLRQLQLQLRHGGAARRRHLQRHLPVLVHR